MYADTKFCDDFNKPDRFRLPLVDDDLVRERVEPVLRNSNLLKKAACKSFHLTAHIREASVPLGQPFFEISKGDLWATINVHWEECGYLTEQQFTDLFTRLAADAIILACEKYGANDGGAKELICLYDLPSTQP